MTEPILLTHNLSKTFTTGRGKKQKTVEAVKGVDLEVKEGEIFGFLGPNGAGKSTTLNMLTTLLTPTSGE
ncbi:MAG TPA: ATP-binding cassette domain-containing protein, partial [Bacteroidia bacterium]|nr:ATP-binding cassette domain-containing protein [Bacteroidia bacterium]